MTTRRWHNRTGSAHAAFGALRRPIVMAGIFGMFANLLLLTGPLYMMQVYDRVLPSQSVETLVVLSALALGLFGIMGILDMARAQILTRTATRFQAQLDPVVFEQGLMRQSGDREGRAPLGLADPRNAPGHSHAIAPASPDDVHAIGHLIASPATTALFDLPFTPVFLATIAMFHPLLGGLALVGGLALCALSLIVHGLTRAQIQRAQRLDATARLTGNRYFDHAAEIISLGAQPAARTHWLGQRRAAQTSRHRAQERMAVATAMARSLRMMLQSGMLGLGAYLAIGDHISAGIMIAASILMGRALAPVDSLIAHWPAIQQGRFAWRKLRPILAPHPKPRAPLALPIPMARLAVSGLTLIPPGHARPVLRAVSFTLSPGEAIGVIGPTGSGKTSLARALTGQWPAVAGDIRLDGAIITQYPPQTRAHYIGYLSQRPILFPGTIGENIARLCPDPDPDSIIAAAKRADAHDMILSLPKGYDMMVTADMIAQDLQLSGGQIQRIGLARALFGDPAIVILDEPNANLDHHGTVALNAALRHLKSQGRAAIIMAHRPAAIRECDRLLMLDDGVPVALGPRDDVLKQVARNPHVLRPNGDPFRDDLNGGLA